MTLMHSIRWRCTSAAMLALALAIAACSTPPLQATRWQSEHDNKHSLVGTVWTGQGNKASWSDLLARIEQSRFILIGEIHTNADHHLFQARVVRALVAKKRSPLIVWEMIPQAMQSRLETPAASAVQSATQLGARLDWATSGWPDWSLYEPIAAAALENQLPMRGAGLERDTLMALARSGADALSTAQQRRLRLTQVMSPVNISSQRDVLREGHCNLLPESALAGMQLAQRARDGAMADAMLHGQRPNGAVLIAGNGHVRNDWAVPALLANAAPGATRVSVAQLEVQAGRTDPQQYAEFVAAGGIYDYVVFTPKSELRDHCAELKEQFSRSKQK